MSEPAERAVTFDCEGQALVGVLHGAAGGGRRGVVFVVGGPQYRVGSHRQFVLMARRLAAAGCPVLRFDHRGIGDSDGESRSFLDLAADICAAVNFLLAECPAVEEVCLLGLCDGATAAALYAPSDDRVTHLALLNPWVRTEAGHARIFLRHYYVARLLRASFWRRMLRGHVDVGGGMRNLLRRIAGRKAGANRAAEDGRDERYVDELRRALQEFSGRVLGILSGEDLVAREFLDLQHSVPAWRSVFSGRNLSLHTLHGADHTLSRREDLDAAGAAIANWLSN